VNICFFVRQLLKLIFYNIKETSKSVVCSDPQTYILLQAATLAAFICHLVAR